MHAGRRRLALKWTGAVLALFGLYALAGFALVPYVIERHAGPWLGPRLGVELRPGHIRFNPFLLRLSADGLELTAKGATQPVLTADAVVADLAISKPRFPM
jgi:hypothetical protein